MASILNATTSSGLVTSADNSGSLQLATNNGTTAVTINTAQKVGIGTTPSGSYILEVNGNPNFNSVGGVYLTCGTYDVIKNPSGNIIAFGGVTSSQWDTTAVYTGGTERMRIDSNGRVNINSSSNLDVSRLFLQISSGDNAMSIRSYDSSTSVMQLQFYTASNSRIGYIQTTGGTATVYSTSSDYRLKENIAPMTGALDKVALLKPCTYTWKSTGENSQGFIAHELAEVVPDCVQGEKDAVDEDGKIVPQGIDTSFLVATLTAAIQELKAELDATKAEVQALKGVA